MVSKDEKWEKLRQQELDLQRQLEETENERRTIERLFGMFEDYHYRQRTSLEFETSRYAEQLGESNFRIRHLSQQALDLLDEGIRLKKDEERRIDDEMTDVYYAKIRLDHEE